MGTGRSAMSPQANSQMDLLLWASVSPIIKIKTEDGEQFYLTSSLEGNSEPNGG